MGEEELEGQELRPHLPEVYVKGNKVIFLQGEGYPRHTWHSSCVQKACVVPGNNNVQIRPVHNAFIVEMGTHAVGRSCTPIGKLRRRVQQQEVHRARDRVDGVPAATREACWRKERNPGS